jgi:hypothetical protein
MKTRTRVLMSVLWPSFLMAGVASAVVFAFIDPLDVAIFGYIRPDREWLYAFGFFLFWAMAAVSSALTYVMQPENPETDDSDMGF